MRLADIEAPTAGTGAGTRALHAIRDFCDAHELPLVVEKAASTWWDRPEHHWLTHAGYDFFAKRWLLYRKPGWPTPTVALDTEPGAMARAAGVALEIERTPAIAGSWWRRWPRHADCHPGQRDRRCRIAV